MSKKILVPIDLSEDSPIVLERARESVREGDEIVMVHVVYDPSEVAGFHIPHLSTDLAREELMESAGQQMDAFVARHAPGMEYRLKMGVPFKKILEVVEEEEAGLIVIGSHKGGPMAHFIVSHASEKVIRNAMIDVLVVPLPIDSEEDLVRRRRKMWK